MHQFLNYINQQTKKYVVTYCIEVLYYGTVYLQMYEILTLRSLKTFKKGDFYPIDYDICIRGIDIF